jgi:histidinol-phosphate/aromatic aminotransferase/cobyric acid decarboxylase-like protein
MPIRARAHVYDMLPYRPGKTPEQLMQSLGLSELIKLSANENPLGASPSREGSPRERAGHHPPLP